MDWLRAETWSPYVVGAGIGILSWCTFLLSDKYLSCSTTFSRLSGMIEHYIRGKSATEIDYYQKTPPVVDWQMMLVLGIVIGAFLSSILSGSFRFEMIPSLWAKHVGHSSLWRVFVSFVGGVLMGIGSRWANGCTSGHGISGTLQMAISSWIVVACLFIAGILTAMLIY